MPQILFRNKRHPFWCFSQVCLYEWWLCIVPNWNSVSRYRCFREGDNMLEVNKRCYEYEQRVWVQTEAKCIFWRMWNHIHGEGAQMIDLILLSYDWLISGVPRPKTTMWLWEMPQCTYGSGNFDHNVHWHCREHGTQHFASTEMHAAVVACYFRSVAECRRQ